MSRGQIPWPDASCLYTLLRALHELSEALPPRVQLSVPPGFRNRTPRACVLHLARLSDGDTEAWEGLPVTTPLRTLVDLADEGRFSREQRGRAMEDALARGLVRRGQVQQAVREKGAPLTRARLGAAMDSQKDHSSRLR